MGYLSNKSVVITGAGNGIGEACARLCASEGATVIVADIDGTRADEVAEEITASGGRALARRTDVTVWGDAESLVDFCVAETGRIDGLVNNAAVMYMSFPGEEDETKARRLIDVNVVGVLACGNFALRAMRRQGTGSIVNVTSGAHLGLRYEPVYGASKGAVASLTYSWTIDNADVPGLRINALSPMANTSINPDRDNFRTAEELAFHQELPPPANNAPVVAFLLSDAAVAVKGQIVRIDRNRLSLMVHPAILGPVLENPDGWTIERIAAAFDADLEKRQVPLGTGVVIAPNYGG